MCAFKSLAWNLSISYLCKEEQKYYFLGPMWEGINLYSFQSLLPSVSFVFWQSRVFFNLFYFERGRDGEGGRDRQIDIDINLMFYPSDTHWLIPICAITGHRLNRNLACQTYGVTLPGHFLDLLLPPLIYFVLKCSCLYVWLP